MIELQWHRFGVQECPDGPYEPQCVLQYREISDDGNENEWEDVPVVDGLDVRYDNGDDFAALGKSMRLKREAKREAALERRCRGPRLNSFLDTVRDILKGD